MRLNPHVVGRFFRDDTPWNAITEHSLNPHVVGRFFRDRRVMEMDKLEES